MAQEPKKKRAKVEKAVDADELAALDTSNIIEGRPPRRRAAAGGAAPAPPPAAEKKAPPKSFDFDFDDDEDD